jgi:hypothetical protein
MASSSIFLKLLYGDTSNLSELPAASQTTLLHFNKVQLIVTSLVGNSVVAAFLPGGLNV